MTFPYKKVLIIGATSGIGEALAVKMLKNGVKVIAAGRRKENLDKLVREHGADKVSAVTVDITELEKLPLFAKSITQQNPDLDCILLNSGIQRTMNFSSPSTLDLSLAELELRTNYLAPLHLTKAFLPFLQDQSKKGKPTALMYTSSSLAFVPMPRCANYCASKAALHQWLMILRVQLQDSGVKVVELIPPAVQTELHDAKNQPDLDRRNFGMPLDEFTEEAWEGLVNGQNEVPVGPAKRMYDEVESARRKMFEQSRSWRK